jgi:spore coat protein U domain-containing protein, fimbrial subunit CupE1/2/3/6
VKYIKGVLGVISFVFTMWVQAEDCLVSSIPVQFGQYNYLDHSPQTAAGSIKVRCPPGTPFRVKLGPGENPGAGFHPRKLRSATDEKTLNYNLFRDSVRTTVWGDGTDNTAVHQGVGTGAEKAINVYGSVPGRQNAAAGVYRDSITVTVEW